MTSHFPG